MTRLNNISLFVLIAAATIFPLKVFSQQGQIQDSLFKDTTVKVMKLKVVYYDFHENGSNPEFQPRYGATTFMPVAPVLDILDDEFKPQLNPQVDASKMLMTNFNNWFRPWVPKGFDTLIIDARLEYRLYPDSTNPDTVIDPLTGDIFVSYPLKRDSIIIPPDTIITDTLYKNVVIEDSIGLISKPFQMVNAKINKQTFEITFDTMVYPNTFEFKITERFLPLIGEGLHASGVPQPTKYIDDTSGLGSNNCFTLELQNKFVYKGGEILIAGGDDDFFVFIDKKKVIDQPGFHGVHPKMIFIDSLNLTLGQTYHFSLFLAARRCANGMTLITDLDFLEKSLSDTIIRVLPVIDKKIPISKHKNSATPFKLFSSTIYVPQETQKIGVVIYDVLGKKVTPFKKAHGASTNGSHELFGSGVYLAQLKCIDSNRRVIEVKPLKFSVIR